MTVIHVWNEFKRSNRGRTLWVKLDDAEARINELEAEVERLKARSCVTCGRSCDTVDESDYEGDDDFYCSYWAEKGTAPKP
jgi:hypothetical protein